jgi:hypothetical protein
LSGRTGGKTASGWWPYLVVGEDRRPRSRGQNDTGKTGPSESLPFCPSVSSCKPLDPSRGLQTLVRDSPPEEQGDKGVDECGLRQKTHQGSFASAVVGSAQISRRQGGEGAKDPSRWPRLSRPWGPRDIVVAIGGTEWRRCYPAYLHGCSGGFVLAARGQLHDEQGMSGAGQGTCRPMPTAREGSRKDCRVADRLYTWRMDRERPHPWDASLGRESSRRWGLGEIIVVVCLHIRIRIRSVFPAGP